MHWTEGGRQLVALVTFSDDGCRVAFKRSELVTITFFDACSNVSMAEFLEYCQYLILSRSNRGGTGAT